MSTSQEAPGPITTFACLIGTHALGALFRTIDAVKGAPQ